MRAAGALVVLTALLAGSAAASSPPTIRIAVRTLADPSIERTLFPRVTDLCHVASLGPLRWSLACTHEAEVRAALTAHGFHVAGGVLETRFPWRRLPAYLAQIGVRGVRRVHAVDAGPRQISFTRDGRRYEFLRIEPHEAAVAFRRGEVDVAPVAVGDLRAALLDPVVGPRVRVRPIFAVDVVRFDLVRGALARAPEVRHAYWLSAAREEYAALVPERAAGPAYGLLRDDPVVKPPNPRRFFPYATGLAQPRVRLSPGRDAELAYGAGLLAADWRDSGLHAHVVRSAPDTFERLVAAYAEPEGIFLTLEPRPGPLLRQAVAASDPLPILRRIDARLRASAAIVPVAWVASARLVSSRLRGWRQDGLGAVDYTKVRVLRARGSSRRP